MSIYEEITGKLDELHQKMSPDNVNEWFFDLSKTFDIFILGEKLSLFRKTLEYIKEDLKKDNNKKEELKKVSALLNKLQSYEPNVLIERLKRKGREVANNKSLKEAIIKESLRLLEQTRLGKRDVVIGMLLRNFATRSVKFPEELLEAAKPKYDVNLFRAFIYAFLSNFIPEKEGTNE